MAKHFLNIPIVYKFGTRWIGYIPTYLSYAIFHAIADISHVFYRSAVKSVEANLRLVYPNASKEEISAKSKKLFRNYAESLIDYGRFTNLDKSTLLTKITRFDGKENLDDALKMGKGVILLTAHLGNWELGGIFFGAYGLKTNVVTLPDEDPKIDASRRWYRMGYGVKTITLGDSPLATIELVKALNNKEVIAMLIDRYNSNQDNIEVEFFNKPTLFPRGPFVLSRITGAPIIVSFVVKEKSGYRGIVEKPLTVKAKNDESELLKKVVKIFERYIVKYADQWYDFRLRIRR